MNPCCTTNHCCCTIWPGDELACLQSRFLITCKHLAYQMKNTTTEQPAVKQLDSYIRQDNSPLQKSSSWSLQFPDVYRLLSKEESGKHGPISTFFFFRRVTTIKFMSMLICFFRWYCTFSQFKQLIFFCVLL